MTSPPADATMVEMVENLLCGGCGYNLRGVPSDRCPECGQQFDPGHLIADLIPWEQRKHIGRVRAFWRTAWMASFRPKQLAAKLNWPVSRAAARAFHAWVVVIAAVTLIVSAATLQYVWPSLFGDMQFRETIDLWEFLLNSWSVHVTVVAVTLWLALATTLVTCFNHPSHLTIERQNQAVTLSHYACAPLVWVALLLLAGTALTFTGARALRFSRPVDWAAFVSQLIACIAIVLAVTWLFRLRKPSRRRSGAVLAASAILVGGMGILLAWMKQSTYTRVIAPFIGERLRLLGIAVMLVPLAWWWVHSVRLTKLACGDGIARTARVAAALLLCWAVSLVVIMATVHTLFFLILMILAWR